MIIGESSSAVAITGLGMCTSLGLGRDTDAAFRAGLMYASETATISRHGEPIRASCLTAIEPEATRLERILKLGGYALDDLRDSVGPRPADQISLFMGVPETDWLPGIERDELSRQLALVVATRFPQVSSTVNCYHLGRSSFFFALESALEDLTSGVSQAVLIGCIDSLCSPEVLQALDLEDRLLGPTFDGIIPGEGAAFVLAQRKGTQGPRTGVELGTVISSATGFESRHFRLDSPNAGEGLSRVLKAIHSRGGRADRLYTCETGESFWTEEFSLAYLRNPSIMPEPMVKVIAAECFGDMGAAAGGVMLGLGLYGMAREPHDSSRGPATLLLCGSSDGGHVGACMVQVHGTAGAG